MSILLYHKEFWRFVLRLDWIHHHLHLYYWIYRDDTGDDDFSIDATPEEDSGEDDTMDSGDNTESTGDTSSDMESDTTEESEIDAAMFDTLVSYTWAVSDTFSYF